MDWCICFDKREMWLVCTDMWLIGYVVSGNGIARHCVLLGGCCWFGVLAGGPVDTGVFIHEEENMEGESALGSREANVK